MRVDRKSLSTVFLWLVLLCWWHPLGVAQGQQTATAEPQTAEPQTAEPAQPSVSIESIEAGMAEIDAATDLVDAAKAELKDLYGKARSDFELAQQLQQDAAGFQADINTAEDDIQTATQQKESPDAFDFESAAQLQLNELNKERSVLEQKLVDAKKDLEDVQGESQRRVDRIAAIADELAMAKQSLGETGEELKSLAESDSVSLAARAKRVALQAKVAAQEATIKRLENERNAYVAQGELPRLQVDVLTGQVKQLEADILKLVGMITERRRTDAEAQLTAAQAAAKAASRTLRPFAHASVELANSRLELATSIRQAVATQNATNQKLKRWKEDFERTKKRIEALTSDSTGLILVERRSTLPSVSLLRQAIEDSEQQIQSLQSDLFEYEDRRVDLSDINATVQKTLDAMLDAEIAAPADADAKLKALFELELQILDSLLNDANRDYSLRIASRKEQRELIEVVEQYREFINENILWVRSAEPMRLSQILTSRDALSWLLNFETLKAIGNQTMRRIRVHPIQVILSTALIVLLFFFRPGMRRKLQQLGQEASRISCDSVMPTLRAITLTFVMAATGPLITLSIGLGLAAAVSAPVRAISYALMNVTLWFFCFELIRHLWRHQGLAESHFGWPATSRPALNSFVRANLILGTPLVFLGSAFQRYGDPAYWSSIGRICMIALTILSGWTAFRLLHPRSGFVTAEAFGGQLLRHFRFCLAVVVIVPLGLVLLTVSGYQYAAYQLSLDLVLTLVLLIGLSVFRALLLRLVRVTRRNIRRRQLIESRSKSKETKESKIKDSDTIAAEELFTDLAVMDKQTGRLITLCTMVVGLIGVSAIWLSSFQAASPILDFKMYEVRIAEDLVEPVTFGNILYAMLVIAFAVAGWQNLPGLVDVFLLGKIRMEASIRYAITTLLQYGIAIAGVIIACSSLGFDWGRMQWLVAALGVGLGFGLQEVVANFVCGVILLFERPIRVGDIVTLGDTTGVVTRIRSRATTVRNYDRQEVVVPNKELITGRITNWTLSDPMNRVVIPIGIAYGSDTSHARELLLEIMKQNSNVLDDPAPGVTFEQFGDSALNLVVRAYLANLDNRLGTIHELHTAIHERFAEERIEIAFPQQDLHLRSIDPTIQIENADRESPWSGSGDKTTP